MRLLETSRGLVDASLLSVQVLDTEIETGTLRTTKYFLGDELVKVDQQLEVSQAALEAAGLSSL